MHFKSTWNALKQSTVTFWVQIFYFDFGKPSNWWIWVKFTYSEKATKVCEIFTLLLSYVVPVKSKVKTLLNCVVFSEYMNFNLKIENNRTCFFFSVSSLLSKARPRWRSLPTGKIRPERTTKSTVTIAWPKPGVPPIASLVNTTPCSPLPSRKRQSLLGRLQRPRRRPRRRQQWPRQHWRRRRHYHHKFLLPRPRPRASLQNLSQARQLLHRK